MQDCQNPHYHLNCNCNWVYLLHSQMMQEDQQYLQYNHQYNKGFSCSTSGSTSTSSYISSETVVPVQDADGGPHSFGTNGCKDTHAFPETNRVSRFCLTLVGEVRLWCESFRPSSLQQFRSSFRQQYTRIRNTRDQLFHAWRSFHFDENSETRDTYVT